jgi:hypothetical protein
VKTRAGPQDRRDRATQVLEHPRIRRPEPQVSPPRVIGVRALRSREALPPTTDPVKEPSEKPDSTEHCDEQRVSHVRSPGGAVCIARAQGVTRTYSRRLRPAARRVGPSDAHHHLSSEGSR